MNTLEDYMELASRTLPESSPERTLSIALGLCGEVGEVLDAFKKAVGHGHGDPKILHELGDAWWYVAAMAKTRGETMAASLWLSKPFSIELAETELRSCLSELHATPHRNIPAMTKHLVQLQMYAAQASKEYQVTLHGDDIWRGGIERALTGVARLLVYLQPEELSLEQILCANIAKLKARYPQGFTTEDSVNRVENRSIDG